MQIERVGQWMLDREDAGDGEDEGPVPVHPQLNPLPDGGGSAAAPRRGPLRGHECGTEVTFVRAEAIKAMAELGAGVAG